MGFRRRRGLRARSKPATAWLAPATAWFPNLPSALANNSVTQQTLVSTEPAAAGTIGITRSRIERVRGKVVLYNTTLGTIGTATMGILVEDEVAGVIDVLSPATVANADKSWMWLDFAIIGAVDGDATNLEQYSAMVDIKVKRILRPHQRLSFVVFSQAAAGAATLSISLMLRTLVSRVA